MNGPFSGPEDDVADDDTQARTRATGGAPEEGSPGDTAEDSKGTTGTGESEEFVGRAAGQDDGYEGETGAERRAEAAGDSA
ncbi:hypothetical protein BH24ACT13_BH24ACT13_07030 [soil metagenome]|jgi:hypothetical protein